jgi:hypothetical protein
MRQTTDMHAHIQINLDAPVLFAANGVTTVRSMSSYARMASRLIPNLPYRSHADLCDKIARGELIGPTVYLSLSSLSKQSLLTHPNLPFLELSFGEAFVTARGHLISPPAILL